MFNRPQKAVIFYMPLLRALALEIDAIIFFLNESFFVL